MKKNNITLVFVAIVFSIIVGMIIGKSLLKYKESIMQIEFRPIEYGKDYDVVSSPDKYVLFIDGKEVK